MPKLAKNNIAFLILAMLCVTQFTYAIKTQAKEYLRKAKVFFRKGNLSRTQFFLKKAKNVDPSASEIIDFGIELDISIDQKIEMLINRADFYLSSKNIPDAQSKLQEILLINPRYEPALSRMKEIDTKLKQIKNYKRQGITIDAGTGRSFDVDSYSAISLVNQAKALFFNGDREKSLFIINKVLAREPQNKDAIELKEKILTINKIDEYINRASKALKQGKLREYINLLSDIIVKQPERYEFLLMRGKAFVKLGEFKHASKDLLKYYSKTNEKKETFVLLAKSYFGLEKYDYAHAFSSVEIKNEEGLGEIFRFRCYSNMYSNVIHSIYIGIFLVIFGMWGASKSFDQLVGRFPSGTFKMAISCFRTMIFDSPEKCLDQLVIIARRINTPWLNYMAGITLLKAGQFEGAQRFLAYTFTSESIAAKSYYFFGILRRLLKQKIYRHDFEESVLASLDKTSKSWHPNFMKKIELYILNEYSKEKTLDTLEGTAYLAVKDQIGG